MDYQLLDIPRDGTLGIQVSKLEYSTAKFLRLFQLYSSHLENPQVADLFKQRSVQSV